MELKTLEPLFEDDREKTDKWLNGEGPCESNVWGVKIFMGSITGAGESIFDIKPLAHANVCCDDRVL